jgi:hypothetical protein
MLNWIAHTTVLVCATSQFLVAVVSFLIGALVNRLR